MTCKQEVVTYKQQVVTYKQEVVTYELSDCTVPGREKLQTPQRQVAMLPVLFVILLVFGGRCGDLVADSSQLCHICDVLVSDLRHQP